MGRERALKAATQWAAGMWAVGWMMPGWAEEATQRQMEAATTQPEEEVTG